MKKIIVFISGSGTNLESIIKNCNVGEIDGKVVAVISNKNCLGIEKANMHDIPTFIFNESEYKNNDDFNSALIQKTNEFSPDIIALAGYMKILSVSFIEIFGDILINLHPSILPKYKGLNTYKKAIENNDIYHGSSVHMVNENLDDGFIIAQSQCKISPNDTIESLQKKVIKLEHFLYPMVLSKICSNQIVLGKKTVYYKNKILKEPLFI